MIRRPPRSTLFPYTTPLPILDAGPLWTVGLFLGPILVLLPLDLRELGMLGDTGSNAIGAVAGLWLDRKSTRLNSSHANISYAGFCLKKKNSLSSLPAVTLRVG